MSQWKEALKRFPNQLPQELQKEVLEIILGKLIEALDTGHIPDEACGLEDYCKKLHDSGHIMARVGYSIGDVLERFNILQDIVRDFLLNDLKKRYLENKEDLSEELFDEHGNCTYKLRQFFQEITSSIAQAYVEEMELIVIEKEKEIEAKEMEISERIMNGLLPDIIPEIDGLDIFGKVLPAKQIGGDFWDLYINRDGHTEIFMADVMGHGISAALLVAMVKYLLKAHRDYESSMKKTMKRLNESILKDTPEEFFVTSIYARIDLEKKMLSFVNAGHQPPLLLRNGKLKELLGSDIPLGLIKESSFQNHTIKLKKNDLLFFLTDGLSDARNNLGKFFGKSELEKSIFETSGWSSREICDHITNRAVGHCEPKRCADDISLVVVNIK